MGKLLVVIVIPTSIRKSGKAYNFISHPFLEVEVIILYTYGQQMNTNLLWISRGFAFMRKGSDASSPFRLEYIHIALNCSGHLVTMKERPKESETLVSSSHWTNANNQLLYISRYVRKINSNLKNHCYLDLLK